MARDHSRTLRRLKSLTGELERSMEDGSFFLLPFARRRHLVQRVRRLYASLVGPVSPAIAKTIAAGAFALTLSACPPPSPGDTTPKADAPAFAAPVKEPFGLSAIDGPAAPAVVDINRDGDADLFAGGGGESAGVIVYFENTGSRTAPDFANAAAYDSFPSSGSPDDLGPTPFFAPLTGTAHPDALVGHAYGTLTHYLEYYANDGTVFTAEAAPSGLPTDSHDFVDASAVDINGDGLADVFVSSTDGGVSSIDYYKNVGTKSSPSFQDKSTSLGIDLPAGSYAYVRFVDIDDDGDFDAFVTNENGDFYYFKNTGTPENPQFAAAKKNPFGIDAISNGPGVPAFVDIDGDGDIDMFVGDSAGDLWYYENTNF